MRLGFLWGWYDTGLLLVLVTCLGFGGIWPVVSVDLLWLRVVCDWLRGWWFLLF